MARQRQYVPRLRQKWRELFCQLPRYDPVATAAPGEWFDSGAADRAVAFFHECLRHIEGVFAGQMFILEPWQRAVIGCLFGWKRGDGSRRYREAMMYVGRGNGKTPLAAGIINYGLFADSEAGAQIYSAASEREQAAIVYRYVRGQIEYEPMLETRCQVFKASGMRAIVLNDDPAASYKVLTSSGESKHGFVPHMVVCDELHAWGPLGRDLMEAIETAFAKQARHQPLLLHITTADFKRDSPCNAKYEYARRVRDGIIADSTFFPAVFELEPDDDWNDSRVWHKANPNLGVTVSMAALKREYAKARESLAYEATFRRLFLNQQTDAAVAWLPMQHWDECPPLDLAALAGRKCWAGLDLSSTRDITALVLLFRLDDGTYAAVCRFWVPADAVDARAGRDREEYAGWITEGHITTTPQPGRVDYSFIRAEIGRLAKTYRIQGVCYDPWNAEQLAQELASDGIQPVTIRQNVGNLSAASKELESVVATRSLRHGGNPVLRWMASNATIIVDANGNIRPTKARSAGKIDGIVAMINAMNRAMLDGARRTSVYEARGILRL